MIGKHFSAMDMAKQRYSHPGITLDMVSDVLGYDTNSNSYLLRNLNNDLQIVFPSVSSN